MIRRRILGAAALVVLAACTDDGPTAPPVLPVLTAGTVHVVDCAGLSARGGAVMVADDTWLTAAHVVREVRSVEVAAGGSPLRAEIVAADARADLALVSTRALPSTAAGPLLPDGSLLGDADPAETAEVLAPSGPRPVDVGPPIRVRVRRTDGSTREFDGFTVDAEVRAGDSGSAVIQGGRVVGMVVLADTRADQGYAVAAAEIATFLVTRPASTGPEEGGCPVVG